MKFKLIIAWQRNAPCAWCLIWKHLPLSVTGFILTVFGNMSITSLASDVINLSMNKTFEKIKEFFLKHEQKIVLFIGFCLISAISFEFGVLQGQKWQQKPLVIEKPANMPEGQETANQGNSETPGVVKGASTSSAAAKTASTDQAKSATNCAFVGSKNSDKFYLPSCSYAKRVKPENLACYASEQEALSKGKIKSDCK